MKTLGMILFLGIFYSLPNDAPFVTKNVPVENTSEEINIGEASTTRGYVSFGRKRRNCTGFGICTAFISTSNSERGTRTTFGFSGNRIIFMHWSSKAVSKETQEKYFKDNVLVIEEEVNETMESDGEKFILQLKPGKYELKEDADGFLLEVSG